MNSKASKVIFLDNFDSFTYNIVDQLRCLDLEVEIYNNQVDLDTFCELCLSQPQVLLILGPGPGTPQQSGNLMAIIERLVDRVPILGICLGHQALCAHFGAKIVLAPTKFHGKTSYMEHNGLDFYQNLPNPINVARYHSLVALDIPEILKVNGKVNDLVMSFLHQQLPVAGFQFHPESIMTVYGVPLLEQTINFLVARARGDN